MHGMSHVKNVALVVYIINILLCSMGENKKYTLILSNVSEESCFA